MADITADAGDGSGAEDHAMQSPSAIELSQSSSMLAQLDSEGTDTSGYPRGPWSEPADVWLAGTHEPLQSPIVVRPCLSACAHLFSLTHSRARTHTTLSLSLFLQGEGERHKGEAERHTYVSLTLPVTHFLFVSLCRVLSFSRSLSLFPSLFRACGCKSLYE